MLFPCLICPTDSTNCSRGKEVSLDSNKLTYSLTSPCNLCISDRQVWFFYFAAPHFRATRWRSLPIPFLVFLKLESPEPGGRTVQKVDEEGVLIHEMPHRLQCMEI